MQLTFRCLVLLAIAGCATTTPPPPPVDAFLLQLSPASYGGELELSQRITVIRDGQQHTFDAQLEVDGSDVRIAAVAMGQTIASMRYDGKTFEKKVSTHVPAAVTAERILSDVQLCWWPVEAVQAGLPAGFVVTQNGNVRELTEQGSVVAKITYDGNGPAWPHVRLEHLRSGYLLDIESVAPSS